MTTFNIKYYKKNHANNQKIITSATEVMLFSHSWFVCTSCLVLLCTHGRFFRCFNSFWSLFS